MDKTNDHEWSLKTGRRGFIDMWTFVLTQVVYMLCRAVIYGGFASKRPCPSRPVEKKAPWWVVKFWGKR